MPFEDEAVGVLIELVGDLFTVVGLTGQRLALLNAESKDIMMDSSSPSHHHPSLQPRSSSSASRDPASAEAVALFPPTLRSRLGTMCRQMLSNRWWFLAFLIFAIGQALELVALGYASESTIVATGNLVIVFNAAASVWVFGEGFRLIPPASLKGFARGEWDAFNLALLVTGSFMAIYFAPMVSAEEEASYDADELKRMWMEPPFIYVFYVGLAVLLGCSVLALRRAKRWSDRHSKNLSRSASAELSALGLSDVSSSELEAEVRASSSNGPFLLAVIYALLAAFSVTMSKITSELLKKSRDVNQFQSVGTGLWIAAYVASLVLQLVLLNLGMREYELSSFIPLCETMGAALTILAGVTYFKTYEDFQGTKEVVGFCSGVLVLVSGLGLASQRQAPTKREMRERMEANAPRFTSPFTASRSLSEVNDDETDEQALHVRLLE